MKKAGSDVYEFSDAILDVTRSVLSRFGPVPFGQCLLWRRQEMAIKIHGRVSGDAMYITTASGLIWTLLRKGSVRDSSRESSMVAGLHEQTYPAERKYQELAGLQ